MRTGTADLPLHGGRCPAWLFVHMKALCAAIVEVIIEDGGTEEALKRLSDPYWFQALGCVVGFDWHSSGVTTTVCGALKEGLAEIGPRAGLFITGGKGKTARNTPQEILTKAEKFPIAVNAEKLVYASKMSAKVDSSAVQDGYQIYHHCFVFTDKGQWAVIQQGMNQDNLQARRYHWLSSLMQDFTFDPQTAICCNNSSETLNLVSKSNQLLNQTSCEIANSNPDNLLSEIDKINNHSRTLQMPRRHSIPKTSYLNKSLYAAYEKQPNSFEQLLQISGIGAGTLRALCMVAEVAYGVEASYADPVRYSFAHGGKDGIPFPVNEADIENSYTVLNRALRRSRAGHSEQLQALKNLAKWHSQTLNASRLTCTPSSGQTIEISKNLTKIAVKSRVTPPASPVLQPGLFDS